MTLIKIGLVKCTLSNITNVMKWRKMKLIATSTFIYFVLAYTSHRGLLNPLEPPPMSHVIDTMQLAMVLR